MANGVLKTVVDSVGTAMELFTGLSRIRMDGWVNEVTGLGTIGRDKLMSSFYSANVILTDPDLEALYEDDICATIVDRIVDDAMRKRFTLKLEGEEKDPVKAREHEEEIIGYCDDLDVVEKVKQARKWSRVFGGAVLYPVTDDGGAPDQELRPENIRSILSIQVHDKRDLWPEVYDTNRRSKTFGQPLLYRVIDSNKPGVPPQPIYRVHASRLIVFEGALTSEQRKLQNNGWSLSVLQKPYSVVNRFNQSFDATSHLMVDSAQGVFKMKGLINAISSGRKEEVQTRMQVLDMGRSVARAMILDMDEEFERKQTTFTGQAEILQVLMLRTAAAARMPVSILFGQAPAGLNATGEHDRGQWEDSVQSEQDEILKPRIEKLLRILLSAKDSPTAGKVPDKWCVEFPPQRQMTEKEEAEIRKLQADVDKIEIDAGIVTPEEVAMSRHSATGWSRETKIDLDLRKQIQEADKARAIEEAKNPPDPVETKDPNQEDDVPADPPTAG